MALKKRSLKLAITTMAIISVVTSGGLNNIYADSSINKSSIAVERVLEDKNYSVKNKIEYDKHILTSNLNVFLTLSIFLAP